MSAIIGGVDSTSRRCLLRGARVLHQGADPAAAPVVDVLLEKDRIAALGTDLAALYPDAVTIDLHNCALVPGFVNAHYHSHDVLAKGMFESLPLEEWSLVAGPIGRGRSVEEIRLRTLLGAIECLRNGITTVQDFSNVGPLEDKYVDAMLDAYAEAGIRVVFAIAVRDRTQLETTPWAKELFPPALHGLIGTEASDPDTQLAFVERQIDRIGERNGLVVWALAPSAPQRCSARLLRGVAELSRSRSLPVYTHVYETRMQRVFAREDLADYNGSTVRYMAAAGLLGPHVTIAHGVWPDAEEVEELAQSGTRVVLNLLSNLRLGSGIAPIAAYRRAGVSLSLGCDNASCSDVQSPFQAMKLFCLLASVDAEGETPLAAEALRLATVGGAQTAGIADRLGTIAPGQLADLVALDLSDPAYRPLNNLARQIVFAESGRGVRHVWVAGRQVVRNWRAVLVDEDALINEVEALMPAIRAELGRLQASAEQAHPVLRQIRERAREFEIGHDRYVSP